MTNQEKLEIALEYQRQTGKSVLHKQEFLDWVYPQTSHPLWNMLFGAEVEELARQRRLEIFSKWLSSIRVEIKYVDATRSNVGRVSYSGPAFVHRPTMDGHTAVSMPGAQADLEAEAVKWLVSWLRRYGPFMEGRGYAVSDIQAIVDQVESDRAAADKAA